MALSLPFCCISDHGKTVIIDGTEVMMRRKAASDVYKSPPRHTNQSMRLSTHPSQRGESHRHFKTQIP